MVIAFLASAVGCSPGFKNTPPVVGPKDAAESALGERLFRDQRFSKFFMQATAGNPNSRLAQGDPALSSVFTPRRGRLENPFAGQAMSCVACHMVSDASALNKEGTRAYADFTQRTLIPTLGAVNPITTSRNTPTLLGATVDRQKFLLHFDGEFASVEDLIVGSYTGRNFGWLPGEETQARANLVRVIREDDGTADLAQTFGAAPLREMFLGVDPGLDPKFVIGADYRVDISQLSDQAVIDAVVRMVKVYLLALQFSADPEGLNNGSPYDRFLIENKLPRKADDGETDIAYGARLSYAVRALGNPTYIDEDGTFGEAELRGLRTFLARSSTPGPQGAGFFQVGNCVACHAPPNFTDFTFHNTGVAQDEYDAIHGAGSFVALAIPNRANRDAAPNTYLPATATHPSAAEPFRRPPAAENAQYVDLGVWNIFANPDYPVPQSVLNALLCPNGVCATSAETDAALDRVVGAFKTPGVRQLDMTDPYFHTGSRLTVRDVVRFYQTVSNQARAGTLRNADPELATILIDDPAVADLTAFLNSLNEEYE